MKILITSLCVLAVATLSGCGSSSGASSNNTSVAGSTATMLTYKGYLLVLDRDTIKVFNAQQRPAPMVASRKVVGAETLHLNQDLLYVGGQTGVDVFNLGNLSLEKLSSFTHVRSCDPVIVDGDTGYLTLRAGRGCRFGGTRNELQIIDFSDPADPELINTYPMSHPYGLAKTPDFLAVCDRDQGLVLLDVADPDNVSKVRGYGDIDCFDLIFHNDTLIATAANGIFQYSVTQDDIVFLSKINVTLSDWDFE